MNADKVRILFFDTSALVKRYHQEKGTNVVEVAFEQEGARIISDVSIIEFFSAFAKKVRTGEITKEDFQVTIKEFAEDILSGIIQLEQFGENEKKTAATLIEKYGLSENLRTLDGMQMAVIEKLGPITNRRTLINPINSRKQTDQTNQMDALNSLNSLNAPGA